jgi:hypothetical protein
MKRHEDLSRYASLKADVEVMASPGVVIYKFVLLEKLDDIIKCPVPDTMRHWV